MVKEVPRPLEEEGILQSSSLRNRERHCPQGEWVSH